MIPFLDFLRVMTYDNTLWVTMFRLGVAAFCGGCIGLERGRKRRPAGFRTHMMVCIGAALAMMTGQFLNMMVDSSWGALVAIDGQKYTDASRLGAQVINGIGFLGAGTIIVTGQQEVKGMTTAAGLWAAACMGLCIGAGFVEGALLGCLLIIVTMVFFSRLERMILLRARNVNIYIEFLNIDAVGAIITVMKTNEIRIFDVEIHKNKNVGESQGAVFSVRLPRRMPHTRLMTLVAEVENVRAIEEL